MLEPGIGVSVDAVSSLLRAVSSVEPNSREELDEECRSGTSCATDQDVMRSRLRGFSIYFGPILIPPSMRTVSPFMYEWVTRKWANSAYSDVVPRRFG